MAKCSKEKMLYQYQQQHKCNYSEIFIIAVGKLHNGMSPGRDLTIGYWYKRLTFCRNPLKIFKSTIEGQMDILNWLAIAQMNLVAESETIELPEKNRCIACLNVM